MTKHNEHVLPSGAMLRFQLAPFVDARNLYQAVLSEIKGTRFNPDDEIDINFIKDIFCTMLSSKTIEERVWKCAERVLYNDTRLTPDIFEDEDARQDYIDCLTFVAWQNILPFGKGLFAQYAPQLQQIKEALKL